MSLLDERCLLFGLLFVHALGDEFLYFLAVVLVESHIIVANQVVALLAGTLRCFAIAVFQPGQHRLANVDTTIVDDIGLHHLIAIGLHDLS